jgi:putative ATP-grasp target RiPP
MAPNPGREDDMTRLLDPLSAQLPTFDPLVPLVEAPSACRPLVMRAAPVAETIHVPTAPEVTWDAALQLPVDRSTGRPELGHTSGTTSTTTQNDSSGPDSDTDASDS